MTDDAANGQEPRNPWLAEAERVDQAVYRAVADTTVTR